MSISSYNKFTKKFNAEISNLSFVKLEDLYKESPDKEYTLTGLFINTKSKFGDRPYASTKDFLVDLPAGMLKTIKDMIADDEIVSQINKGGAGFKVITYMSDKYGKCYSVEFIDF